MDEHLDDHPPADFTYLNAFAGQERWIVHLWTHP
jgi:hypothetical protein